MIKHTVKTVIMTEILCFSKTENPLVKKKNILTEVD